MALDEDAKKEFERISAIAAEEAKSLGHDWIGTEHLFLALLRYEQPQKLADTQDPQLNFMLSQVEEIVGGYGIPLESDVASLLRDSHVDCMRVRNVILSIIGKREKEIPAEVLPGLTPRSKKVMKYANGSYADDREPRLPAPIHVLYGIFMEGEGIAAGVLESFGVTLEKLRHAAEKYRPNPS